MLSLLAVSTCAPPYSPYISLSLTFNKLHLYPHVLLGFFHAGMQESRSSENTVLLSTHSAINSTTDQPIDDVSALP
jgi:hypothetical protein